MPLRPCPSCTGSRDHRRRLRGERRGVAQARASSSPARTGACRDLPVRVRWVSPAGCRDWVVSRFRRACLPTSIIGFFNGAFQPHLDQMQHAPINNTARHRLHEVGMGDASEVVRKVSVYDIGMATVRTAPSPRSPPAGRCAQHDRRRSPVGDQLRRSAPAPASPLSCRPDPAPSRCPAA